MLRLDVLDTPSDTYLLDEASRYFCVPYSTIFFTKKSNHDRLVFFQVTNFPTFSTNACFNENKHSSISDSSNAEAKIILPERYDSLLLCLEVVFLTYLASVPEFLSTGIIDKKAYTCFWSSSASFSSVIDREISTQPDVLLWWQNVKSKFELTGSSDLGHSSQYA